MTSLPRDILLIFVSFHACTIPHDTGSLKIGPQADPQVVLAGKDITMFCPFNLEEDVLYSVMWYKDHEEFYRFVPKNSPQQHSYPLEGFRVDKELSNDREVLLKDVTLKASGKYRCEVSAEAPSFTSVHVESALQVIAIPEENPQISGQDNAYGIGDTMNLNCVFGKSYPPAKLEWFINDELVSADFVFNKSEDSELVSSTTTLHLLLQPYHFLNGQMAVRCVATVGPMQSFAKISPLMVSHKETSLLVQARGSSASSRSARLSIFIVAVSSFFF